MEDKTPNSFIHQLEHVRQLYAIQTMGGVGQAIPAVLVPNGQNFWTPRCRTAKKCNLS